MVITKLTSTDYLRYELKQISWNWKCFLFQSLWWERRAFPLKDEDIEALLCQDEKNNQVERSSPAFHREAFCTSAPENGHHPKRQTDGMEEYKTLGLGLTHVKNNRWQGTSEENGVTSGQTGEKSQPCPPAPAGAQLQRVSTECTLTSRAVYETGKLVSFSFLKPEVRSFSLTNKC